MQSCVFSLCICVCVCVCVWSTWLGWMRGRGSHLEPHLLCGAHHHQLLQHPHTVNVGIIIAIIFSSVVCLHCCPFLHKYVLGILCKCFSAKYLQAANAAIHLWPDSCYNEFAIFRNRPSNIEDILIAQYIFFYRPKCAH